MYVDLKLVSFIKMYAYESRAPFQLKHEFIMVVAGPSKSGKTEFVKQFVQNTQWISPPPEKNSVVLPGMAESLLIVTRFRYLCQEHSLRR
jgi:septin family protein